MKLKALASALWMGAKRHSPEILVGLGIAGAASSVIFAIKATPRAMILLDEKRQELGVEKLEAQGFSTAGGGHPALQIFLMFAASHKKRCRERSRPFRQRCPDAYPKKKISPPFCVHTIL